MGDGDRGRAHLGHNLADQRVDDPRHDRVQPRGRFVKENHLRIGADRAGQADPFLHPARKFGGEEIGGFRCQTHAAQLFDGDLFRLIQRPRQRSAQQAEGDVLPDGQAVKQRPTLEQHAECVQKRFAIGRVQQLAANGDLTPVRHHQTEDAFQQHRFAGARAADHHKRLAFWNLKVDPLQYRLFAKRLMHIPKRDHVVKNASVRMKFDARISTLALTTAALVARPTPCAPRPEFMP